MTNKSCDNLQINSPEFWRDYAEMCASKGQSRAFHGQNWDRAAETYDDLETCQDYQQQVETVLSTLQQRGALQRDASVLDVGCGTGTYAVRMAGLVKSVCAVDFSEAMLGQLKAKVQKASIPNITAIHADWREYEPDKQFDLVFCSMTPLLRHMQNVDKVLGCSKRFVAIISWAGVKSNPLFESIYQEIFGKKDEKPCMDIIPLFNYLYTNGFAPDVRFFHACWERTRSIERQVEAMMWQLELKKELSPAEKARISQMVAEKAQNGQITVKTKVRLAFLMIDKTLADKAC